MKPYKSVSCEGFGLNEANCTIGTLPQQCLWILPFDIGFACSMTFLSLFKNLVPKGNVVKVEEY